MDELALDRSYRRGDRGTRVRTIQEWLCLRDHAVVIDGDFGPATQRAVRAFQDRHGMSASGSVGKQTYAELVRPMTEALGTIEPGSRRLGALVVAYARQHLRSEPREVGGQNRGPWVRLYMNGREGAEWPWCAGFVCYVLKQACASLGVPLPIRASVSCDSLAASAKERGVFLSGDPAMDRNRLRPGALFLSRRTATDWSHVGIVVKAEAEAFHTVEGNTNDAGDREGYEVCARTRGYLAKDFVAV